MLIWNDRYAIGIPRFDAEHVMLLGLLNQLHINQAAEHSGAAVRPVLAALTAYAEQHCAAEEALMAEMGYPELSMHQESHAIFRARIDDLDRGHHNGIDVARALRATLGRWLLDHIAVDDTRFGDWLRAGGRMSSTEPTLSRHRGTEGLAKIGDQGRPVM